MNVKMYWEKYYSIYFIHTASLNNVLMNSDNYCYFLTFFLIFFILGSEIKRKECHYCLAEHVCKCTFKRCNKWRGRAKWCIDWVWLSSSCRIPLFSASWPLPQLPQLVKPTRKKKQQTIKHWSHVTWQQLLKWSFIFVEWNHQEQRIGTLLS